MRLLQTGMYVVLCFTSICGIQLAHASIVGLQNATATYSQSQFSVASSIDGDLSGASGWAVNARSNEIAVWETVADVGLATGTEIVFTIYHQSTAQFHNLGRFRLSYTTDDRSTFADGQSNGGDVTANWTPIDLDTFTTSFGTIVGHNGHTGTGGDTLSKLPDLSILAGGTNPSTTVYNLSTTLFVDAITGLRIETFDDSSLPTNGPGRASNGNFVISEFTVEATNLMSNVPEPTSFIVWGVLGILGLKRPRRCFV